MPSDPGDALLDALVPAVRDYRTPQFDLAEDLRKLARVRRVEAPEAVILYCARVLEALAAAALATVGLQASDNVFSNLDALQQYNLLPTGTRYWAHALRRLGNDVRHIHRQVGPADAEQAALFVESWLEWFFRHFRYGPRLPSLTRDDQPLGLSARLTLRVLLKAFAGDDVDPRRVFEQSAGGRSAEFLETPVLPAALAETLLDQGDHAAARAVLNEALLRFPDDLRLQQLQCVSYSRTGDLDEALAILEPLRLRFNNDDETAGITAGSYKRKWLRDPGARDWLERAHRAYFESWNHSKKTNAYLGINAATTALWLERPAEARRLAEEVSLLLRRRAATLAAYAGDRDLSLNYWDHVTLAEAELLLGRLGDARHTYHEALAQHPEQRAGNFKLSCQQAGAVLPALGLSLTLQELLDRPASEADEPRLVIGVTGDRTLLPDPRLPVRVRGELLALLGNRSGERPPRLLVLCTLAGAAERFVADLVLAPPCNGLLHAVLPLELADYCADFSTDAARAEFKARLDRAETITFPPIQPRRPVCLSPAERADAYEEAGQFIVQECSVLLALWDGQPAKGPVGPAEVVGYARQAGKPVVWVHTTPPYEVERLGNL